MMRSFLLFAVLLFPLIMACESVPVEDSQKPNITGDPGSVLIVVEDHIWKTGVSQEIINVFNQYCKGLNTAEYILNTKVNTPRQFGDLQKTHRNIIFIRTGNVDGEAVPRFEENRWANGQLIIKVTAHDTEELQEVFNKYSYSIARKIQKTEIERLQKQFKAKKRKGISQKLITKYGIDLDIPSNYNLVDEKEEFVWIEKIGVIKENDREYDRNHYIYIYFHPYADTNDFSDQHLLELRDSIMKENVPGPSEGSYMSTEYDPAFYPVLRESSVNGKYAAEIRGLWRTEGNFMGGPFISLTTYDESNQRMVTVEGCFYMNKPDAQREYVRELEAILYSLEVNPVLEAQ